MARKDDTQWLEKHGGTWRVSLAVPRELRGRMPTRLKKSLRTDSLRIANERKLKVVAELKRQIAHELHTLRSFQASTVHDAIALAPIYQDTHRTVEEELKALESGWHNNEDDWDKEERRQFANNLLRELDREIAGHQEKILGAEVGYEIDEHSGQTLPVYNAVREQTAKEFGLVARGAHTPFDQHLEAYHRRRYYTPRTKRDDARALAWAR